ncbi:MAG: hypothetical protein R3B72_42510 [Polyangiaceae bacterium]
MFVLRLEPTTGAPAATTRCGDGAEQSLAGLVAASSDDDLFALLGLQGSINLGGAQPLLARGTQDGLLAQLDVAP